MPVAQPKSIRDLFPPEFLERGSEWELPLSDEEFNFIRKLAMKHAGIEIADYKKNMVRRRISKRLKALGISSHDDYCKYLNSPEGDNEIQPLINALTTNKTEFFREKHHFDHLAEHVVPGWMNEKSIQNPRRVRIWSAGCSMGHEPYSIAMCLTDALPGISSWDVKILATDIDTEVLETAKQGVYSSEYVNSVPPALRAKYMQQVETDRDAWRVSPVIRSLLTFKPLNLHGTWPMRGPFDIIFCRNVVIYFDRESQRRLFNRFADLLPQGGLLYCGHSESLFGITNRFRPIGKSIYEKN